MDKGIDQHEPVSNVAGSLKGNQTDSPDVKTLLKDNKKLLKDKEALLSREKEQTEELKRLKAFEQDITDIMSKIR